MAVNNVSDTPYADTIKQKTKEYKSSLDKDAFLNLLVTQLRNQNPLEPMEDKEFISQMAQFTALEQTQAMNKTMKMNSAFNMTNKYVHATYRDSDTKQVKDIEGIVEKAIYKDNSIYVVVDGKEVLFDDIKEVSETVSSEELMSMINFNTKFASAYELIGKNVKGKYYDTENKKYVEIEGKASSVYVNNNTIYLKVNEKDVLFDSVSEVK